MNRKKVGANVDEKDIRKHINDIVRLYQLLSLDNRITMPQIIKHDMQQFLIRMENEKSVDFKSLGLKHISIEEVLIKICQIHGEYREGIIISQRRNRRLEHRKRKVKDCFEDGMANGSDKLYKLCENLLDNFDKLWTFMKVFGMKPTNNLAERDMRKIVIWKKKSWGTRSERGKRFVERISTVAQTLRKQGKNILGFIQKAVTVFYSKGKAPFISPALGF